MEVRFAPDDASSTISMSIFRPLTPPFAFSRSIRAWHALPAFLNVEPATPVSGKMYPSFTALALTPGSVSVCAPAPVVAIPANARPATTVPATARTKRVLRCFNSDPPVMPGSPPGAPCGFFSGRDHIASRGRVDGGYLTALT